MSESLAIISLITELSPILGADRIDLAKVLNYQSVVKKGEFQVGSKILFIFPDTVLPDVPWAQFYRAKSNRVKAIKLKKVFSQGIIERLSNVGLDDNLEIGLDVADILKIQHYEAPTPQNLDAKGNLPFGIFKTDEQNFESLDEIPYGQEVIVTLKIDGSNSNYYCKLAKDGPKVGICSRSLDLKLDSINPWTKINEKYNILDKLKNYCVENNRSLCLRGECFGPNLNKSEINPHCKLPLDFAAFNVLNLDTLKYENFTFCQELCKLLEIPVVPAIKKEALTLELIKYYSEDITELNGVPFEGIVCKMANGESLKVKNRYYDSKK